MTNEQPRLIEQLEGDPNARIHERAPDIALGGLHRQTDTPFSRVDPVVGPSLAEGFAWILDTPAFQNATGRQEQPGDEDRAIEIGNMYSYGLAQGMSTGQIDRRYSQALE